MKITFLIYDNDSTVNDFPLGVGYLISMLRKEGFDDADIHLFHMDVYHYSDEQLFQYLNQNSFDAVCIGMIAGYWQYRQLKRMCAAINRLKKRPILILGGYMFTPEPQFFMKKFGADYVVLGEGEKTFPDLLKRISGERSVDSLAGIAYWASGEIVINDREPPVEDIDSVPFPAWDRFPIEAYVSKVRIPMRGGQRSMPVLSSRGCLYKCSFCYRMEKGYRQRSLDSVMEECKQLIKDYQINAICFRDELLMSTPQRGLAFAERILKEDLNIHFDIDGRLNAVQPDVLSKLKKAGCVYINYGVESLDQSVLNNMNKKQTIEEIERGIEMTVKAGIHPGLNVIFGNIGDNRETAMKTVDFLKKYNTYGELRTLKPVTPYPGSPLYYYALEHELILDCEDFYENKHLNSDLLTCNFTTMSDEALYSIMFEANDILIKDHFENTCRKYSRMHRKLYFDRDVSFRGVRH